MYARTNKCYNERGSRTNYVRSSIHHCILNARPILLHIKQVSADTRKQFLISTPTPSTKFLTWSSQIYDRSFGRKFGMTAVRVLTRYRSVVCRSQWPRVLRRRSAAARLLRSWIRIPPGACMFVCCECCVLSGRGLCDELITRPEESCRLWCIVVCDLAT